MELKKLNIEVSQDLLESLKKACEKENLSNEQYINRLLEKELKKTETKKDNAMPSVALIKNDFNEKLTAPENTNNNQKNQSSFAAPSLGNPNRTFQETPKLSSEQMKRKQSLEEQMKEVSLLIETADSENKKEEYLQTYAQLASELESLL